MEHDDTEVRVVREDVEEGYSGEDDELEQEDD